MSFSIGRDSIRSGVFVSIESLQTHERLSYIRECLFGAVADGPAVADDDGGLFRAGNGGVQQVAMVHEGLRLVDDHDDAFALGTLHFVDG